QRPDIFEQGALTDDLDFGAAILAFGSAFDLAAKLLNHRHLAIADAQHRHAKLEDALRSTRCMLLGKACRTARKDDRSRRRGRKCRLSLVEGNDLAIDAGFPYA